MDIPVPIYKRLPLYVRELRNCIKRDVGYISSKQLGKAIGVTAETVRQDFVHLPCVGCRGKGYQVEELYETFKSVLGWDNRKKMVIIGTNYLARALWEDTSIDYCGFIIVGVFSFSRDRCTCWKDIPVKPFETLQEIEFDVGVIATGVDDAQLVANKLVEAGAEGIWSFANTTLVVPAHVSVVYHNICHSLSFLTKQFQRPSYKAEMSRFDR